MGELIGVNDTWFRYRLKISGANDLTEYKNSGTYYLDNVTSDLPFKYGSLVVFNSYIHIVQFAFIYHSNSFYIRTNWNSEKWTNWEKMGTT